MNDAAIRLGILKCRELVELYYGAGMVTDVIENQFTNISTVAGFPIIPQDPRRIKYVITWVVPSAGNTVKLGSQRTIQSGGGQIYGATSLTTIVVTREWRDGLDEVCAALWALPSNNAIVICTRETFLTPLPADEQP